MILIEIQILHLFMSFHKIFFFYILAPKNLKVGDIVESGLAPELNTGNALPLFKIPEGSFINSVTPTVKKKLNLHVQQELLQL